MELLEAKTRKGQPQRLTVDRPSSPGVRQLSVGEVSVRVKGDRGVFGVRGEGSVSQALYPLGGGVGIATPERWQQLSASNIQASKSFSLSQSNERERHGFRDLLFFSTTVFTGP